MKKNLFYVLMLSCVAVFAVAFTGCGDDEAACDEGFESDGDGGCVAIGGGGGTDGGGTAEGQEGDGGEGEEGAEGAEGAEGQEGTEGSTEPPPAVTCVATGPCAEGNKKCPGKYDVCLKEECKPVACTSDADCADVGKCDAADGSGTGSFKCDTNSQCVRN